MRGSAATVAMLLMRHSRQRRGWRRSQTRRLRPCRRASRAGAYRGARARPGIPGSGARCPGTP